VRDGTVIVECFNFLLISATTYLLSIIPSSNLPHCVPPQCQTQPRGSSSATRLHRLIRALFCTHFFCGRIFGRSSQYKIERELTHLPSTHACMLVLPTRNKEGLWSLEYKCLVGDEEKGAAQSR
jgi:hypothetical protein